MRLWRISKFADLSGEGGLIASARWHSRGRRIVYLVDHPASALLEAIVHLEIEIDDLPDNYKLLAIEAPDDIAMAAVELSELQSDWRRNTRLTRSRGDDWLSRGEATLLRVPSAIVAPAFNFLLNPVHPDRAKINLIDVTRIAFDPRLFR